MKVIVFTSMAALLIPIVHIGLVGTLNWQANSVKCMLSSLGVYLCLCLLSLTVFKNLLVLDYVVIGSVAIFFCLGYMEAFSMICRGFSLHIMIDIYANGSLNMEEIKRKYGAGKGVEWLFDKRLANLQELHLVGVAGGMVEVRKPFGVLIGAAGLLMKRILKMGAGG